jgi:cytochrome c oxidase assembly protein subunit 15
LNEALLGALLVLLGKVAHDQSASRAVYLALHLTNTLLLLAALALTAHFLSRKQGFMRGSVEFRAPGLVLTGLIATLIVGVTGSLAALGDTLYPATSLRAALAQDFSNSSSWIVRIRWAHPVVSLIAGVFLLWLVFHGTRSVFNRKLSFTVAALLFLQYALGVADIALLAPTWMQMVHLLGADLLWIALIILAARLCVRPIGCTEGLCSVRAA